MIKKYNRFIFIILSAGIIFSLCFIFRQVLTENIFKPFSLMLWLFLRIFVLSIDQNVLWWGMILAVIIFKILNNMRIYSKIEIEKFPVQNTYMQNIEFWRSYLSAKPGNLSEIKILKRKMAWMLVSIYASGKRIEADFKVYEAFENRDIPLPDYVYLFLFSVSQKNKWYEFGKWIKKINGKDASEHYQDIEKNLKFLENFLEAKDESNHENIN